MDNIFVKLNILFINFKTQIMMTSMATPRDQETDVVAFSNLTGNYSKLIHVYGFQSSILYCLCEKRYICKILSLNTT